MNLTREEVVTRVNNNDKEWFYELYNRDCPKEFWTEFKIVYDQNYGDGNDWEIAIHFINYNIFIKLEGSYSSWDSPYWDRVSFATPYEHKETRYKRSTLAEIRDNVINTVLDENKKDENEDENIG